jgi:hypothetical protein
MRAVSYEARAEDNHQPPRPARRSPLVSRPGREAVGNIDRCPCAMPLRDQVPSGNRFVLRSMGDSTWLHQLSTLGPSHSVADAYSEMGSEGESLTTPSESVVFGLSS